MNSGVFICACREDGTSRLESRGRADAVGCQRHGPRAGCRLGGDACIGRHQDLHICAAEHRDSLEGESSAFVLLRGDPSDGTVIRSLGYVLDRTAEKRSDLNLHPSSRHGCHEDYGCITVLAVAPDGNTMVSGFGLSAPTALS